MDEASFIWNGKTDCSTISVKDIGIYPNGDMVYIYPDGLYELWNSTILNYIREGENRASVQINSNMGRFYKCRARITDYQ